MSHRVPRRSIVLCLLLTGGLFPAPVRAQETEPHFVRADANADGEVNISDVSATLNVLFLGEPPDFPCRDAADANDDGSVDISDAVTALNALFANLGEIPPPFYRPEDFSSEWGNPPQD